MVLGVSGNMRPGEKLQAVGGFAAADGVKCLSHPVLVAPAGGGAAAGGGVYGIIGNHDYPSGCRDWLRFLRSCGIRMPVNEHAPLGNALTMAGVNDPMAERNHEEAPNLPKALAGTPAARPVVLPAHEPIFADTAAKDKRVSLQLSGHTHGGYVKELYRVGSMPLYVSSGTSLRSGMPVRLFCPAEITFITLRPAAH